MINLINTIMENMLIEVEKILRKKNIPGVQGFGVKVSAATQFTSAYYGIIDEIEAEYKGTGKDAAEILERGEWAGGISKLQTISESIIKDTELMPEVPKPVTPPPQPKKQAPKGGKPKSNYQQKYVNKGGPSRGGKPNFKGGKPNGGYNKKKG